MALNVTVIPCLSDNYAYLLFEPEQEFTAIVDVPDADACIAAIEAAGNGLDTILITHHHDDHIQGVAALVEKYGCQVIGGKPDVHRLPPLDEAVEEGDFVFVGSQQANVIDVSGHTVGHIAFHFPESGDVFTADSLMALGCGRVFEGTFPMMWDSLSKLAALPDETRVWSGHNYGKANGAFAMSIEPENAALVARIAAIAAADAAGEPIVPVTLAEEKATNPFLRAMEPSVAANVGLPGADAGAVFAEVRARKDNF